MTVLSVLLIILIILASLYNLFALVCILGFFRAPDSRKTGPEEEAALPPVSVLKAIKGLDPRCAQNLSSFCVQDYPCYEVLFGFRDRDDPAIPVAGGSREVGIVRCRLVVRDGGVGPQSESVEPSGPGGELELPPSRPERQRYGGLTDTTSGRIVSEYLRSGQTGIVTSLYKISNPSSVGSALESISIALDFIPSVLVARRLEGVTFALGASILVSREALREIGGFESVADYLADDYQIGYRIWRKVTGTLSAVIVIENRVGRMSAAEHVAHQLRWARTYRASRPWGFLGYGLLTLLFLLPCSSV